jgi:hypothetical protein
MRSHRPTAALPFIAFVAGIALSAIGCSLFAAPGSTTAPRTPRPTLTPAFGMTWAPAPNVERPADAFAISSNPPTGPEHPDTAGHPGHFPGQAVIEDVATNAEMSRLVAVGYVGLEGNWKARAWSSTDGLTWSLASIDERTGSFAVSVAAASDGTFVAVGRVGRVAAAWRSPDGTTWQQASVATLVTTTGLRPPDLAERMTVVVATPAGLLAGGSVGDELQGNHRARLWRSADGSTWVPVADASETFRDAEVTAIVVTARGSVALGNIGGGARPTGSLAWTSADGTSWTRADDPALAAGLAVSIVPTARGYLAAGSDPDEREAVAWISSDGRSWTKAPTETSRLHSGEKIRMTDVVLTPSGLIAVGNYVGLQYGTGTSWLSKDGLTWTMAPDQPTFGQAEPQAVIAWRDRLVIVGSRGAPDNYIPSVWLSPGLP